jgi:hypothetical protein
MIAKIAEIRSKQVAPASGFSGPTIPENNAITGAPTETILGTKGEANNGMFKVSIGHKAKMHGREDGKQMGVNTWAALPNASAD